MIPESNTPLYEDGRPIPTVRGACQLEIYPLTTIEYGCYKWRLVSDTGEELCVGPSHEGVSLERAQRLAAEFAALLRGSVTTVRVKGRTR